MVGKKHLVGDGICSVVHFVLSLGFGRFLWHLWFGEDQLSWEWLDNPTQRWVCFYWVTRQSLSTMAVFPLSDSTVPLNNGCVSTEWLDNPPQQWLCFHWPRPGDSYWVLYCIYNTCMYWVYSILTMSIVIFPILYNTTIFLNKIVLTSLLRWEK